MTSILRSIAALLLKPWLVLSLLLIFAIGNLWRKRVESRVRLALVSVPALLLLAASCPAVSHLAHGSLEWRYTERYDRPSDTDAIVVLGGYVSPPNEVRPFPNLGNDSLRRALHAVRLYQNSSCPITLAGGILDSKMRGPSVAEAMAEFLKSHGISEHDLILETTSQSTFENARQCREILEPKGVRRIVLVTDSLHMRRAEACFRAQGFDVVASPCMFHASKFRWELSSFLPSADAASDLESVLHEWIGLFYYKVQGRI